MTNELKEKSGIYKITNTVNGNMYIGSAVNLYSRKNRHFSNLKNGKHDNRYLQRAYNKYGKKNFLFETVEFCAKNVLIEREQYYIDEANKQRINLYNLALKAGNNLGVKYSEASKKRISKALTGKKQSLEHSKHNSEAQKGKKLTEETKRKISIAAKRNFTPLMYSKLMAGRKGKSPMLGKHHTEETKRKLSIISKKNFTEKMKQILITSNSGRPCSIITRKKIGDAQRGIKNHQYGKSRNEEIRKKISEGMKKYQAQKKANDAI